MRLVAAPAVAKAVTAEVKIFLSRDPADLECFGDHLMDAVLDLLNFFLGSQKVGGNFIGEKVFAQLFESDNFLLGNFRAGLLLLLQQGTALVEGAVFVLKFFVRDKGVNLGVQILEGFLVHDGFAELIGTFLDGKHVEMALGLALLGLAFRWAGFIFHGT